MDSPFRGARPVTNDGHRDISRPLWPPPTQPANLHLPTALDNEEEHDDSSEFGDADEDEDVELEVQVMADNSQRRPTLAGKEPRAAILQEWRMREPSGAPSFGVPSAVAAAASTSTVVATVDGPLAPSRDSSTRSQPLYLSLAPNPSLTVESKPLSAKVCLWQGCRQPCADPKSLAAHLRSHVNAVAPYTCEWLACHKRSTPWTNRGSLLSHLRTHTGEKLSECPVPGCDMNFVRPDALRKHMISKHGGPLADGIMPSAEGPSASPTPRPAQTKSDASSFRAAGDSVSSATPSHGMTATWPPNRFSFPRPGALGAADNRTTTSHHSFMPADYAMRSGMRSGVPSPITARPILPSGGMPVNRGGPDGSAWVPKHIPVTATTTATSVSSPSRRGHEDMADQALLHSSVVDEQWHTLQAYLDFLESERDAMTVEWLHQRRRLKRYRLIRMILLDRLVTAEASKTALAQKPPTTT